VNGLGAVLVIVAFQPTSSTRYIVTDPVTKTVIATCSGDSLLYAGSEVMPSPLPTNNAEGEMGCPQGDKKALAEVDFENPLLAKVGFGLMVAGIIWQIVLIREPTQMDVPTSPDENHPVTASPE
jgi:hypothetical protein